MENNLINKLMELAQKNSDIVVLWLYGSRAKGTAQENSDYDLAIAFKDFIKDPLEAHLRPQTLAIEWISELQLADHELSIVDIAVVPIPLAWEVIQYGRVIYASNANRAIWEDDRIRRQMEIDVLYHRSIYGG